MEAVIKPGFVEGTIRAVSSKSLSLRALTAALLRPSVTYLKGIGNSADEKAAVQLIRRLGAEINRETDSRLKIVSSFFTQQEENAISVNCSESGLLLRMFAPVAALRSDEITISGEGSLLKRPLLFSKKLFDKLDVHSNFYGNSLPLRIKGPLKPVNIEIDGGDSSQLLTGLLFAFSAAHAENVTIRVTELHSRPYIDLTLSVLEEFGMLLPENKNYEEFYFHEVYSKDLTGAPLEYIIEGDWSNAAFLLVAGAVAGNVSVKGLNLKSRQADRQILEVLKDCGCRVEAVPDAISVKSAPLNSFQFDATHCPDLFPPLVALAANCTGVSIIKGVSRLKYKESNRAVALQKELGKLGLPIRIDGDNMIIEGVTLKGGVVDSNNDHRIAMACAVATLRAKGNTIIKNAEAVQKSYPSFYEDLKRVGIRIDI